MTAKVDGARLGKAAKFLMNEGLTAFLLYRKVLEIFLYNKNKMSTGTKRRCQLKLTVLGSQSGASPS